MAETNEMPQASTTFQACSDGDFTILLQRVVLDQEVTEAIMVKKARLIECSAFFEKMLTAGKAGTRTWKETNSDFAVLKGKSADDMLSLLKILHDFELDSTYTLSADGVLKILVRCDEFDITFDPYKTWFEKWYQHNTVKSKSGEITAGALLYPSLLLNHAQGFAAASKALVYDTIGTLEITNDPTHSNTNFRVPSYIVRQIYAVRSHIRTRLVNTIFEVMAAILGDKDRCCKDRMLMEFDSELKRIGIAPFDLDPSSLATRGFATSDLFIKPIKKRFHSITESIEDLSTKFQCAKTNKRCCESSQIDLTNIMQIVAIRCRDHFDGFCLDCMKRKRKHEDDGERINIYDSDNYTSDGYGIHHKYRHDKWCQITHREPTAYWSALMQKQSPQPKPGAASALNRRRTQSQRATDHLAHDSDEE